MTQQQGTKEWLAERAGKITASRMVDVMNITKKGEWGAGKKNYFAELVAERLTGKPTPSFISGPMQHGIDTEPKARVHYVKATEQQITESGFVAHPLLAGSGASPDGRIGADGLIEIKCPNMRTHLETLMGGQITDAYAYQMQWQMACTGAVWCDYVSFDDRFPENLMMRVQRVDRDPALIAELELAVKELNVAVIDAIDLLMGKEGQ